MNTELLESLYEKYEIKNYSFGTIHDKLGDVYEEYCVTILEDKHNLELAQSGKSDDSLEFQVFKTLFSVYGITDYNRISAITATNIVPKRATHGSPKTDVIATVEYADGVKRTLPISCKQSTVSKVAFAEFDTETICHEVGITDERLKALILKHQTDCSAKKFTVAEKQELRTLLAPIARDFVRWVITGSPKKNPSDVVYPTAIIKFVLRKPKNRYDIHVENGEFEYQSFKVYTIEDYIDSIMHDKRGKVKNGGFGTGLSWTYATGSRNQKIQFKA